jgi:hypothetical protein
MTCREIQELLPDYSAEALSRQQMQRVREHLGECATCAGELTTLDGVLRLVERWGAVEPPPGLWAAVYREIGSEARVERRGVGRSWWAGLLALPLGARLAPAALAAAAVAVFFVFQPPQMPEPPVRRLVLSIPVLAKEPEMVAAVQQHSLASAGLFLADRAGLESVVQIVHRHGGSP